MRRAEIRRCLTRIRLPIPSNFNCCTPRDALPHRYLAEILHCRAYIHPIPTLDPPRTPTPCHPSRPDPNPAHPTHWSHLPATNWCGTGAFLSCHQKKCQWRSISLLDHWCMRAGGHRSSRARIKSTRSFVFAIHRLRPRTSQSVPTQQRQERRLDSTLYNSK